MTIEFTLPPKHAELKSVMDAFGKNVVRPMALTWDREKHIPHDFLRNFARMATQMGSNAVRGGLGEDPTTDAAEGKRKAKNLFGVMAAEGLSWADPALLLNVPGPGLGGPALRASGTPAQKEKYFGIFDHMDEGPLAWGAYGLTEPNAGSDVAGIRTSCRRDGKHWVLSGRKCFITNGARAAWTVIFATIDPALGRAGHRAFIVEKGTPGFSVGRIEDKMGLRASETAELLLEECRVPEENLLGGENSYVTKEGFMTAMKTFDNTRPLVAAMACGIGRAAYEYARDFVKENYVLSRPIPRYAAIAERLAKVGRHLEAARSLTWRAAWMTDAGLPNAKEASMCKALAGQAAIFACIEAIGICGAEGSLAKDHQLLEKWFRDIKVYDIFEGTGQIQRIVISKRLIRDLKSF